MLKPFTILLINFFLFSLIAAKDVQFIELEGLDFLRSRTVNGESELVCDENEGENLCENFKLDEAKCTNQNYKKERTAEWYCSWLDLNDEVVVKDYQILCDQIDEYSFKEGTCILEYKLKVNKDNGEPEAPKDIDPLVYVIYIIGAISALVLLTLIMFFSYKLIQKYRTRKFSF